MMTHYPIWLFTLNGLCVLIGSIGLGLWLRSKKNNLAPLPKEWALGSRPIFTSYERRIYRLLCEILPNYIIVPKLPLVRFCQPIIQGQLRYWYDILGNHYVSLAICSTNGKVLAVIDINKDRETEANSSRSLKIKRAVLRSCRIRYHRTPSGIMPTAAEIFALLPLGHSSFDPQTPPNGATLEPESAVHNANKDEAPNHNQPPIPSSPQTAPQTNLASSSNNVSTNKASQPYQEPSLNTQDNGVPQTSTTTLTQVLPNKPLDEAAHPLAPAATITSEPPANTECQTQIHDLEEVITASSVAPHSTQYATQVQSIKAKNTSRTQHSKKTEPLQHESFTPTQQASALAQDCVEALVKENSLDDTTTLATPQAKTSKLNSSKHQEHKPSKGHSSSKSPKSDAIKAHKGQVPQTLKQAKPDPEDQTSPAFNTVNKPHQSSITEQQIEPALQAPTKNTDSPETEESNKQNLSKAREALATSVASRRVQRNILWQESPIFQDAFFAFDSTTQATSAASNKQNMPDQASTPLIVKVTLDDMVPSERLERSQKLDIEEARYAQ